MLHGNSMSDISKFEGSKSVRNCGPNRPIFGHKVFGQSLNPIVVDHGSSERGFQISAIYCNLHAKNICQILGQVCNIVNL